MSTTAQCLNDIIGLASESQCECSTAPEGASDSDSNVFMSSLIPPSMFKGLANCDNGDNFWSGLFLARESASISMASDLFTRLRERGKPARQSFNGAIGRISGRTLVTSGSPYLGVRLFMANVVGGYASLNKIGTYFEHNGTVTVRVINQFGDEMGSYDCETTAWKHKVTTLTPALVLPMHDNYVDNYEYFIIYEYDSANKPIKNDTDCGCGSFKPMFNTRQPSFITTTPQHQAWAQWAMIGGYVGHLTNLETICQWVPITDRQMHGLTLDMTFRCSEQAMICGHAWDFNNPLDISLALALNFKSVSIAIEYLLRTPEFNSENLINREILELARVEYLQEYDELMKYCAQEYPIEETDCWTCITPVYIGRVQR